jgi:predicted DNA-binding transcriptional regulator YafY
VSDKTLKFIYKNWKGVTSERSITPIEIVFTQSSWHGDENQWFMKAVCCDKGEERMFLMKDIVGWL